MLTPELEKNSARYLQLEESSLLWALSPLNLSGSRTPVLEACRVLLYLTTFLCKCNNNKTPYKQPTQNHICLRKSKDCFRSQESRKIRRLNKLDL